MSDKSAAGKPSSSRLPNKGGCLFAVFGSALHIVKVDSGTTPWTFDSYRIGDAAHVPGVRQNAPP